MLSVLVRLGGGDEEMSWLKEHKERLDKEEADRKARKKLAEYLLNFLTP